MIVSRYVCVCRSDEERQKERKYNQVEFKLKRKREVIENENRIYLLLIHLLKMNKDVDIYVIGQTTCTDVHIPKT